jgi:hypothetical protein
VLSMKPVNFKVELTTGTADMEIFRRCVVAYITVTASSGSMINQQVAWATRWARDSQPVNPVSHADRDHSPSVINTCDSVRLFVTDGNYSHKLYAGNRVGRSAC